ncbi:hypothetical protein AARI_01190 [Glutamicibacter arilaitensis Re117]|uniref:Uncharacterized protein n=1 Tax=Glutamicibacter arilaitensis (strain DSM 16368 / CIP 108037 / IAM 15318 / JCM 13566 / NCIMB 14258 / Re117) TaxID=861360 RepID=A0ABM9PT29_GLUAR|nr:hypothetical protein AARI_01190 [Glutamicibacter arilaitensis Re117]
MPPLLELAVDGPEGGSSGDPGGDHRQRRTDYGAPLHFNY